MYQSLIVNSQMSPKTSLRKLEVILTLCARFDQIERVVLPKQNTVS